MILTLRNQVQAHCAVVEIGAAFVCPQGEEIIGVRHSAQNCDAPVHQKVLCVLHEPWEEVS